MAKRNPGFTIVEVAVSTALIAVLLVGVAQAMALVAQQRRASQYRLVATQEVANILEYVAISPYDQLTPEQIDSMRLPAVAEAALPGATLRVDLTTLDTVPPAKRVTVQVAWTGGSGQPVKPVRVVTWKYNQKGTGP